MSDTTVKVPTGKPADWGIRKADAMHTERAVSVDRQVERAANRKAAADEQREARRAKRQGYAA